MKNKEEYNEYARNYYQKNRERLLDLKRKRKDLDPKKFKERNKESTYKWRKSNKEKYNSGMRDYRRINKERINSQQSESQRKRRNYWREIIFSLLGNKCSNSNCPISPEKMDFRCLQIDHVNSDGYKQRKKINFGSVKYYKLIKEEIENGSKDYQLLCANCNWIKRYEKREFGGKLKWV